MRNKTEIVRLGPEVLDKVWYHWLGGDNTTQSEKARLIKPYGYLKYHGKSVRTSKTGQKFEAWLFREHGGTIRQHNKQTVIEFNDPVRASWFLLKTT